MDVLSKNLEAIKKVQPTIYNELLKATKSNNEYKFANVNNIEVLYLKHSKGYYIQQTSMVDPIQYARDFLLRFNYEYNSSLFIQIGISGGYILQELFKQINKKSKVLCVERNIMLLKEILKRKDFSQQIRSNKLFFIVGSTEEIINDAQIKILVYSLFKNMIGNLQTIVHPIYDYEYISYAKSIIKVVQAEKELLTFKVGNDIDDTLVGLDNNLTNILTLINNPGINDLLEKYRDAYKGKPAIIVASGPSLNKNIDELKRANGKALILSCDGSYKALSNRGIKIDGIGSVERIKKTYEAFYENETFHNDTVLVAPIVVQEEILNKFKTKKLLFTKQGIPTSIWLEEIVGKGAVSCGLSVSHMLFGLARKLGCNPIILVGQDLAYSKEGISHVKEAEAVIEKIEPSKAKVYVKDYNGEDIASTFVWEKFLKSYEEIIKGCDETIIDASEGGAYIDGTIVSTLKEAIEMYCKDELIPLRKIIDSINVDVEYVKDKTIQLNESIKNQLKSFNLLRSQACKGLEWISRSISVLEKGLNTSSELDDIYDCIDYTGKTLIKKITNNYMKRCLFQYPIYVALHRVSEIKSDKFTKESIKENLIILKELLTIIEVYTKKTLKVLYKHYNSLSMNIEGESKGMKYIEKHIASKEFDIPLNVVYGYNINKGKE